MFNKLCNLLLGYLTKHKRAMVLSPLQIRLALISEQNGTPVVDWNNVFVVDQNGEVRLVAPPVKEKQNASEE